MTYDQAQLRFATVATKQVAVYYKGCSSLEKHEKRNICAPKRDANRPRVFVKYGKLLLLRGHALEVFVLCRMDEQERSLG
jgi:hypothetical protein